MQIDLNEKQVKLLKVILAMRKHYIRAALLKYGPTGNDLESGLKILESIDKALEDGCGKV